MAMNLNGTNRAPDDPSHLVELVVDACSMLRSDAGVKSVHVVPGRAPTRAERREIERLCELSDLDVTLGDSGSFAMRPRDVMPAVPVRPPHRAWDRVFAVTRTGFARCYGCFPQLAEGTR
jgi:hypothetical protein